MHRVIVVNLSGVDEKVCNHLLASFSGHNLAQEKKISTLLSAWGNQAKKLVQQEANSSRQAKKIQFSVKGLPKRKAAKRDQIRGDREFQYLIVPQALTSYVFDIFDAVAGSDLMVILGDPENWIAQHHQGEAQAATEIWLPLARQLLKFKSPASEQPLVLSEETALFDRTDLGAAFSQKPWGQVQDFNDLGEQFSQQDKPGLRLEILLSLVRELEVQKTYETLRGRLAVPDHRHAGSLTARSVLLAKKLRQDLENTQLETEQLRTEVGEAKALQIDNHLLELMVAQLQEEIESMKEIGAFPLPVEARSALNPKIVRLARMALS